MIGTSLREIQTSDIHRKEILNFANFEVKNNI